MPDFEPDRPAQPGRSAENIVVAPRLVRRALPWWATVGVLLLVFLAGGVAGAMVAARTILSQITEYRENPAALPAEIVPRLQSRLGLSDEQTNQVRIIIEQHHPQISRLRLEGAQAMHAEFDLMQQKIESVLRDHQRDLWRSIVDTVRLRFLPARPAPASAASGH